MGSAIVRTQRARPISCLGWFAPDEDERAAQRLLLNEAADVEDRVSIYVCPEDGDVYCGALTTIIEWQGDEMVWRDVAHSTFDWLADSWDHEVLSDLGELRFNAGEYWTAITSRPRTM
jgi:hypothetical protein